MKSNLFALQRQLEIQTGRAWPLSDIARATGLTANTMYNLANNRTAGAQYDTLARLLDFFRGQGMEIEVGDLFLVEEAA